MIPNPTAGVARTFSPYSRRAPIRQQMEPLIQSGEPQPQEAVKNAGQPRMLPSRSGNEAVVPIFQLLRERKHPRFCHTPPQSRRSGIAIAGFTLIELLIVMSVIVILVSVAVPLYQKSILRTRETVLRSNLMTLRTTIDEYTYDKQKAPQALQDLVQEGYLKQVPKDPITDSNTTWRL